MAKDLYQYGYHVGGEGDGGGEEVLGDLAFLLRDMTCAFIYVRQDEEEEEEKVEPCWQGEAEV